MGILKNLLFLTLMISEVTSKGRFVEPLEGDCTRFAYEYRIMERLIVLEQENKDLKARLDKLEQEKNEASVAVTVGLSGNQDLGQSGRVMYDVVSSNVGKAYDLEKGEFVAPVSGQYLIVVQACLGYGGKWMILDIEKDGAKVGRVFSGDDSYHNCGSKALALHLDKDSKIWISRLKGTTTVLNQEYGWNSFTAVLVQQDKKSLV